MVAPTMEPVKDEEILWGLCFVIMYFLTIRHKSRLFIPEIWMGWSFYVILHRQKH